MKSDVFYNTSYMKKHVPRRIHSRHVFEIERKFSRTVPDSSAGTVKCRYFGRGTWLPLNNVTPV